jgi:hypothetical protein
MVSVPYHSNFVQPKQSLCPHIFMHPPSHQPTPHLVRRVLLLADQDGQLVTQRLVTKLICEVLLALVQLCLQWKAQLQTDKEKNERTALPT